MESTCSILPDETTIRRAEFTCAGRNFSAAFVDGDANKLDGNGYARERLVARLAYEGTRGPELAYESERLRK
jgi:hypothetical protein